MSKPSDQELDIAIMWLRINDGDGGEGAACQAVSNWLDTIITARNLRRAAREAGIPVKRLRQKLVERTLS